MKRAQIAGARFEVTTVRPRDARCGGLQAEFNARRVFAQDPAPLGRSSDAFRFGVRDSSKRETIPNGDESRAFQQRRSNRSDSHQQISIAQRLFFGYIDGAEKKIADRNCPGQWLDVLTV